MIFKSSTRAGRADLASHLLSIDTNETASVTAENGLGTRDLAEALWLLEVESQAMTKAKTPFVHAACSPDQSISDDDWDRCWRAFEDEFGLTGANFIEVTHVKLGRLHKHRVYSRWNASSGQSADYNHWSKIRDQVVSRTLEHDLSHEFTAGPHDKEVMYRLRRAGRADVADWIKRCRHDLGYDANYRARGERRWSEHQADQRGSIKTGEATAAIFRLWQEAQQNGRHFADLLTNAGFTLARGDKSPFVVIAPDGRTYDLGRALRQGAKALGQEARFTRKQLKEALADIEPSLKGVDAAKTASPEGTEQRRRRPGAWQKFQQDRQTTAAGRAAALDELKARQKAELQAEAERFRAAWPRVREALRKPGDYHRARSVFALTKAERFAALKAKHMAERREYRRRHRTPTYDEWLAMQAEDGQAWAAKLLSARKLRGRFRAARDFPPEPPVPADLRALTGVAAHTPVPGGGIAYLDAADRAIMTDYGRTLDMHQVDENSIRAALLLAREKWGWRVRLRAEGDAQFMAAAERVALELGIDVSLPGVGSDKITPDDEAEPACYPQL